MDSMDDFLKYQRKFSKQFIEPAKMMEERWSILKHFQIHPETMKFYSEQMDWVKKMNDSVAWVSQIPEVFKPFGIAANIHNDWILETTKFSGLFESLKINPPRLDEYFKTDVGTLKYLENQWSFLNDLTKYIPKDQWINHEYEEEEEDDDGLFITREEFIEMQMALQTQIDDLKVSKKGQIDWKLFCDILNALAQLITAITTAYQVFCQDPVQKQQIQPQIKQTFIDHGYEIKDMPTRIDNGNDMFGGEKS